MLTHGCALNRKAPVNKIFEKVGLLIKISLKTSLSVILKEKSNHFPNITNTQNKHNAITQKLANAFV